jgi:biotin synthase
MHDELGISLCASMGLIGYEQLVQLREAGVVRYHCNLETSREFFGKICTTHAFDDKIATIRAAQEAGLFVCSGGIIGMGESWDDRISLALELAGLGVKSIPLNVLMAIPGTPLEGRAPLSEDEILRAVALFRYLNPDADIRLAGGRTLLQNAGEHAFTCGASATITGNMLTTASYSIATDKKMFARLNRTL